MLVELRRKRPRENPASEIAAFVAYQAKAMNRFLEGRDADAGMSDDGRASTATKGRRR